jgi:tetratricopeptide (TPR) repeat protein
MVGDWEAAIGVNQQLLERYPKDVDALNRLGKAYFELRQFRAAYEAYRAAVDVDPANIIARRNVERLESLRDTEAAAVQVTADLPPNRAGVFIHEAGKTYVDELVAPAPHSELRLLSSGDKLELRFVGGDVEAVDRHGNYIGKIEPRLARRLDYLVNQKGNSYAVYVTANSGDRVRFIIRETERGAEMGDELSFPQPSKIIAPRAYLSDARLFRGDDDLLAIETEDDDEEAEIDEGELTADDEEESDYLADDERPATQDEDDDV